jgi:hypothetical protein
MVTLTLNQPPPERPLSPTTQPRTAVVSASRADIKVPLTKEAALALQPFASATAKIPMTIRLNGWRLTAALAPKSVRRVLALLREHGAERIAILVQGRLSPDDEILEASLITQLRPMPKVRSAPDGDTLTAV